MPINTEWPTASQSPLHSSTFNKKSKVKCAVFLRVGVGYRHFGHNA